MYDIVDDGLNGFVVPAFDVARLSDIFRLLIKGSPQKRFLLQKNAIDASKRFDVESISQLWMKLFNGDSDVSQ